MKDSKQNIAFENANPLNISYDGYEHLFQPEAKQEQAQQSDSGGNLATDIPKGVARGLISLPDAIGATAQTALGGYAKIADLAAGNENAGQGGAIENDINSVVGTVRDYTTRPLANWAEEAMPYSSGTQAAQGKLGTDLEAIMDDESLGYGQKAGLAFGATAGNLRGTLPSLVESIPQFMAGSALLKGAGVAKGLAGVGSADELTAKAASATARATQESAKAADRLAKAAKATDATAHAGFMKSATAAEKFAASKADEAKALMAQAAKADRYQNAAIVGLGNATLEGAGASKAAHDEIIELAKTNPEQLMKNPQFAQLANERGFNEAVRITAEQAGNTAYAPAAGLGAAASFVTGGGLEGQLFNRLTGSAKSDAIARGIAPTLKAMGSGAVKGGLREGVEETMQGASGQFSQNLAMQPYTGVDLSRGVIEQAVSGGVMGLASGGVGSGAGRAYDKATRPSLEDVNAANLLTEQANQAKANEHAKAIDDAKDNGNILQAALLRATSPAPIVNATQAQAQAQNNVNNINNVNAGIQPNSVNLGTTLPSIAPINAAQEKQRATDEKFNADVEALIKESAVQRENNIANTTTINQTTKRKGFKPRPESVQKAERTLSDIDTAIETGTLNPSHATKLLDVARDVGVETDGKNIQDVHSDVINAVSTWTKPEATINPNAETIPNEVPAPTNTKSTQAQAEPTLTPSTIPASSEVADNSVGAQQASEVQGVKASDGPVSTKTATVKKKAATPKNEKQKFVSAWINTENSKADKKAGKKTRTPTEKARDTAQFTAQAQDEYDNRIVTALNNGEKLSAKAEIPDHGLTIEEYSHPLQPNDELRASYNEVIAEAQERGLVIRNQTNDTKANTTTNTAQPKPQRANTDSPAVSGTGTQESQATRKTASNWDKLSPTEQLEILDAEDLKHPKSHTTVKNAIDKARGEAIGKMSDEEFDNYQNRFAKQPITQPTQETTNDQSTNPAKKETSAAQEVKPTTGESNSDDFDLFGDIFAGANEQESVKAAKLNKIQAISTSIINAEIAKQLTNIDAENAKVYKDNNSKVRYENGDAAPKANWTGSIKQINERKRQKRIGGIEEFIKALKTASDTIDEMVSNANLGDIEKLISKAEKNSKNIVRKYTDNQKISISFSSLLTNGGYGEVDGIFFDLYKNISDILSSSTGESDNVTKTQAIEVGKPTATPKANTVFTEDMANAARERLRAKLGRLNSGVDPEMFADGIVLAGYHIEKGARTFSAYAKAMVADMGDEIKPYLKQFYYGVKSDPRAGAFAGDMDKLGYVEDVDIEDLLAEPKSDPAKQDKAEQIAETKKTAPDINVTTKDSNSPEFEGIKTEKDKSEAVTPIKADSKQSDSRLIESEIDRQIDRYLNDKLGIHNASVYQIQKDMILPILRDAPSNEIREKIIEIMVSDRHYFKSYIDRALKIIDEFNDTHKTAKYITNADLSEIARWVKSAQKEYSSARKSAGRVNARKSEEGRVAEKTKNLEELEDRRELMNLISGYQQNEKKNSELSVASENGLLVSQNSNEFNEAYRKGLIARLRENEAGKYSVALDNELQDALYDFDDNGILHQKFMPEKTDSEPTPSTDTQAVDNEKSNDAQQSEPAKQTLHALIASGNVNAVLDHIKANSGTKLHQQLAGKLIGNLPNKINISIVDDLIGSNGKPVPMNYSYGNKTVSVNPLMIAKLKDVSVEKGFLHELIHAVTGEKIDAIMSGDNKTLSKDEKIARTQLKLISNLIKKHVGKNGITGDLKKIADISTTNLRELITYGLTEPAFQRMLADISMGKEKTAWTKFVNAIAKLLGIELNQEQETALSTLLMVGDGLLGGDKVTQSPVILNGFDVTLFSEKLLNGDSFKTIVQARKALSDIPIQAGTVQAKQADEAIELAGVIAARQIVAKGMSKEDTFDALSALAEQMPSLNVRTSTSIAEQAYSTPLALAYVASVRAGIDSKSVVTEPTAGNGALLISSNPDIAFVNELNADRVNALKEQGFNPTNNNATTMDFSKDRSDVVIANPPFGTVKDENSNTQTFPITSRYKTNEIDHAISFNALKAMKPDGTAVLIVGGVMTNLSDTAREDKYNGAAKRAFYGTLYNEYNVVDHFTVSGDLYAKQGAGYPVDVIVINGKGKSELLLPAASLPRVIQSTEELKNELQDNRASLRESREATKQTVTTGTTGLNAANGTNVEQSRDSIADKNGRGDNVIQSGLERNTDATRGNDTANDKRGNSTVSRPDGTNKRSDTRATAPQRIENAFQAEYTASSSVNSIGTLVPINMQSAINSALAKLNDKYTSVDNFVASQLNYEADDLGKYFSAEQVDAIALALNNIIEGKGFIIGDQTGVGKGRVNAAMIRYAILNNITPIFVTEKPNLYSDMIRDLNDIGMSSVMPFATNSGSDGVIPLNKAALEWDIENSNAKENRLPTPKIPSDAIFAKVGDTQKAKEMAQMVYDGKLSGYDAVFTTYSQMQTIKGAQTDRMDFIEAVSKGALLILDESHNAGGTSIASRRGAANGGSGTTVEEGTKGGRAGFTRQLVQNSQGVFYSSATYAKRPDVLDLYSKTDMGLIADPQQLKDSLQAGGVPLQQAVASMLAQAGQYIRREKSFDGIVYDTVFVDVDRQFAERASEIMRDIMQFDVLKGSAIKSMDKELKADARKMSSDRSTGGAGASSLNFTSVMHNMIGQMLLMLKVQPAIDEALAALKRGEKPVITLSNTMGSAIDEYAEDAGLNVGDAIGLHFGDLLARYLSKSRRVIEGDMYGKKESRYLTDEELGVVASKFYKSVMDKIDKYGFDKYPVSPIDAIHNALHEAGYKTGEITGRNSIIDYSESIPVYKKRPASQKNSAGKRKTISDFNNGMIDAVILNQSGATGLSLHSSPKVGTDTRKRHMIIAQPELNIDTHMQMLGRVNRTGQSNLPSYGQLTANIPAEKRPSAILAKKMAGLNAATTAGKDSAVKAKDVPDFMNDYGDEVAAAVMNDNRDIHALLGSPLKEKDTTGFETDGAMRRVTGRIPVLSLADQEKVYTMLEDAYDEYIDMLNKTGQNQLEAKAMALDAKTVSTTQVVKPTSGSDSPFAEGVNAEIVDAKRLGKPYTVEQILELIKDKTGITDSSSLREWRETQLKAVRLAYDARMAEINSMPTEDDEDIKQKRGKTDMLDAWSGKLITFINGFSPSKAVLMFSPTGGQYLGFVGNLERKGDAKNYFAMGNWKLTVYVADAAKSFTIPLSRISATGVTEGKWSIEPTSQDIKKAIEEGSSESREERTILTGNMLAAYSFDKSGQIVNYTNNQGETKQGILMPKKFDLAKALDDKPVVFQSPRIAQSFIGSSTVDPAFSLRSADNQLRIIPQHGNYVIRVPASKSQGGQYFLNPRLISVVEDQNFVKRGNEMVGTFNKESLGSVLDIIYPIAGKLQPINKDKGKEFLESTGVQFSKSTTPTNAEESVQTDNGIKFSKASAKVEEENPLAIVHNLSLDNLIHAQKQGGLAVPSVAVVNQKHTMENFGEITLIADKSTLSPERSATNRFFNADIYSPRYGDLNMLTKVNNKKFYAFLDSLSDIERKLTSLDINELERKGMDALIEDNGMRYLFLIEKGKSPTVVYEPKKAIDKAFNKYVKNFDLIRDKNGEPTEEFKRVAIDVNNKLFSEYPDMQIAYDNKHAITIARKAISEINSFIRESKIGRDVDRYETSKKLSAKINEAEFKDWLEDKFSEIIEEERIITGRTYSGNYTTVPHDLSNVVKLLTKSVRGGEGFNYRGVGNIRAHMAKQFKTIASMQKARNDIVDNATMKALAEETDNELKAIEKKLNGYAVDSRVWASEALADLASKGIREFNKSYSGVPKDTMDRIYDFLDKLKNMPTEYFEGKIGRAVGINEFSGAIVPTGKEYDIAVEILKKNGVTNIKRYKKGDVNGRSVALSKFADLLFSKNTTTTNAHTKTSFTKAFTAQLDKKFGQGWTKLLMATGKVKVVSSEEADRVISGGALKSIAWHGSPYDHNGFSHSMIGEGEGALGWGFGTYLTKTKAGAVEYKRKLQRERGEGKVYKVDIPDQKFMLDLSKEFDEQSKYVQDALKNIPPSAFGIDGDKTHIDSYDGSEYVETEIEQRDSLLESYNGLTIYQTLMQNSGAYDNFGSEAEASGVLLDAGIKGNTHTEFGNRDFVVFSEDDLQILAKYSKNGKVQAFYNPANDTTYFVADNIDKNKDLLGLAAHELGVHALQLGKDDKNFKAILSEVDRMIAANSSKAIKKALARAKEANTKPEHVTEETLSYLIENHPRLTIVQKFLNWFKNKLRAIGKALPTVQRTEWFRKVTAMTESDLVGMAVSALRNAPNDLLFDSVGRKGDGVMLAEQQARFYSALRRAFLTAPNKVFTNGQAVKAWINGNAGKFEVKKDELYWSGINEWLDIQGKVSRDDVVKFLDENGVKVEDVELKRESKYYPENSYMHPDTGDVDTYENWESNTDDYSDDGGESIEEQLDSLINVSGDLIESESGDMTKHNDESLVLPNGTDYRELVLTIPAVESWNENDDTHFGDVASGKQIAWIRHNTRTDNKLGSGLFLEEVQSQRGSAGRTKGFSDDVPPAPFITDNNNKATNAYISLLMKKAISAAIDNGQNFVAWTTGDQQAERYNLSKSFSRIKVGSKTDNGQYHVKADGLQGENVISSYYDESDLPNVIGAELAKTAIKNNGYIFDGESFNVSPQWTQAMYGNEQGLNQQGKPSLITQSAGEIARKFGGKIGTVNLSTGTQPAMIITPEMRQKVLNEGMPLFSKGIKKDTVTSDLFDLANNLPSNADSEYFAAIKRGDVADVQRLVNESAEKSGVPILQEDGITAYQVRRTAPPKKTAVAYKLFRVKKTKKGEVFALFVGAEDPLPQGVWLDATAGAQAPDSKTGRAKVKSKIGNLAFRPGWHAGDIPLATHIGAKDKDGNVFARKDDEVWAEVEMADDVDYQPQATANGTRPDGRFVVGEADIKEMPTNGLYRYKTNPNMTGRWIISGAMKINRILSEDEVNDILKANDAKSMPWATQPKGSKTWEQSSLDLSKWGLNTNPAQNQKKLLDPITYDDNGNIIPLSQRFDKTNNDIRYSMASDATDTIKNTFSQKAKDKVIYLLQDKYIDLKRRMQDVVKNGGVITEDQDPRMAEELYHKRLSQRVDDFLNDELNPILKGLHDAGLSMDGFQKFLHAKHAPSRNAVMAERNPNQQMIDDAIALYTANGDDKELARWKRARPFKGTEEDRLSLSGISDADAQAVIDALSPSDKAKMQALADKVYAINQKTLDLQVEYGLETQQTIDDLNAAWENYVPLHRDEAHPEQNSHPVGSGFSVQGSAFKNATGSNSEVTNILSHIAMAREQALTRGEKARVDTALINFLTAHPDPDFAVVGKVPTVDSLVNGFVETHIDPSYRNKDNYVMTRHNGKDIGIEFNPRNESAARLALALKNMDGADLDMVENIIAKGTRWMAAVNTQYNLVFGIMNLMRDAQGGLINLSSTPLAGKQTSVMKAIAPALKAIYGAERGHAGTGAMADLYREYSLAGGTTGFRDLFADVNARHKAIQREFDKHNDTQARVALSATFKWLSDFNTAMENSVRLAAYKVARENGLSIDKSASIAKNLTVNFNGKGAATTKIGAFYAFFNASVQGNTRMFETLRSPAGKKIIASGVALGAMSALIGITAMGADDWDKIPEFIRERNLIIPDFANKGKYFAVPMPLGFHLIPNFGRKAVEIAFGSNKVSSAQRLGELITMSIDSFNPLGGKDIGQTITPTVADPIAALWRNKDWTGKSIYKEDFNSLKPTAGFNRTKDTATGASKLAAEAINKLTGGTDYKQGAWSPTPDQIDYVFGQLGGGTYRELSNATQAVASNFNDEELPMRKVPLLGKLYGETSGNSVERGAYYDNVRRLNTHETELDGLRKEPNGRVKALEYIADNPDAKLINKAKGFEKIVNNLMKKRKNLSAKGADVTVIRALDDRIAARMKVLNDSVMRSLQKS